MIMSITTPLCKCRKHIKHVAVLSILVSSVATVASGAIEELTQQSSMRLFENGSRPLQKGPENWFTGSAWIEPLNTPPAPAKAASIKVTFEPGARTRWHSHPLGQTLIVTSGKGWTQMEGGPIIEMAAGDVVWCPPDQTHWHGATPTSIMTHIAVQETHGDRGIDWKAAVTDEQYSAGPSGK
jgi:quercetin dioxygenase-like cupin family protein